MQKQHLRYVHQRENTNKPRSLCNNQTTWDPTLKGAKTDTNDPQILDPKTEKITSRQALLTPAPLQDSPASTPFTKLHHTSTLLIAQEETSVSKAEHQRRICYSSAWHVTHAWNRRADGSERESGWDAESVAIFPRNQFWLVGSKTSLQLLSVIVCVD